MASYQLFHTTSCPYCVRVRKFLDASGIEIPLRDTMFDAAARQELISGGGRATVPCLRIETDGAVSWLYESLDIIEYLRQQILTNRAAGKR
jgi:glutathione S-transferase